MTITIGASGVAELHEDLASPVSAREAREALETIERIVFWGTEAKLRTGSESKKEKESEKDVGATLTVGEKTYHQEVVADLPEAQRGEVLEAYEVLQDYFMQHGGHFGAGWYGEKLSMRIRMTLLVVRTRVLGEFFLPD